MHRGRSRPRGDRDRGALFLRHGDAFITRLKANASYVEEDFAHINRIDYKRPFDECLTLAESIVDAAMGR